jgi:hypothetical protein
LRATACSDREDREQSFRTAPAAPGSWVTASRRRPGHPWAPWTRTLRWRPSSYARPPCGDVHRAMANRGTLSPGPSPLRGEPKPFGKPWYLAPCGAVPSNSPGLPGDGTLRPRNQEALWIPRAPPFRMGSGQRPGRLYPKRSPLRGPTSRGIRRTARDSAPCEATPEHPERRSDIDLATVDRGNRSVSAPDRHPCGHRLETTHWGYPTEPTPLRESALALEGTALRPSFQSERRPRQATRESYKPRTTFRARSAPCGTPLAKDRRRFRYSRHGTPCEARCPEPLTPYR